jgi:hypothetical protein
MTVLATPPVEIDKDFEVAGEVTKTWVSPSGKRYIRGVASGVEEDRDGERCSVSCIKGMVTQINAGGIALTAGHDQDWLTEFGAVAKGDYDSQTGELLIECELPAAGEDPVADKAWKRTARGGVGFSVGGKLRSAFFERSTDTGKRRKVLDDIGLKHICLTQKPAYSVSFAETVGKTFEDEPPDDDFTIEVDPNVEKDTTGSWVGGGGGNSGGDSVGSGPRNAGERKGAKGPSVDPTRDDEDDEDADDDNQLPKAKDERHLACPHCGHEFAADLPVSPSEQPEEDNEDEHDTNTSDNPKNTASKTTQEIDMPLKDTLDVLKGMVENHERPAEVAKTEPETAPDVYTDVEKMVAVAYDHFTEREDAVEKTIGEGFELIASALRDVNKRIDEIPAGRKSVARQLPSSVGHTDTEVEKATEIQDEDDAVTALKKMNARHPAYANLA